MPTEAGACAVFFFAHQDDEFGVFQALEDCRRRGLAVYCVYMTTAPSASNLAERRNAESLRVLAALGVPATHVVFAGDLLGIEDASLPRHLGSAFAWLHDWLGQRPPVAALYVTAWEGGHHDHDALHALVALSAVGHGMLLTVRQYSLYNCYRLPKPLFRVLTPLIANGPARRDPIAWRDRLRFLRFCLAYPTQAVTWVGLFPFVLLHHLRGRGQLTQQVSLARLDQRPHEGDLYYERRGFYQWDALARDLATLRLNLPYPTDRS